MNKTYYIYKHIYTYTAYKVIGREAREKKEMDKNSRQVGQ